MWNPFKKKDKEKEVKTEATKDGKEPMIPAVEPLKTKDDYPFVIQLFDIFGSSSKEVEPFAAKREIIEGNVYLVNEKFGFKERFPEDNDIYKEQKLDELNKQIQSLQDKIALSNGKEITPEVLDMRSDLRQFKAWKKSLELQGKGSYVIYTSNGAGSRPKFSFDRKGNFKFPIFKDIDHSLLRVPTEAQITTASELLLENEKKNGKPDNFNKLLAFGLVIVLTLAVCVMGFFMWKMADEPSDVSLALVNLSQSLEVIAQDMHQSSINFQNSTSNINDLIDRVELKDKPPQVTPAQNTIR